MITVVFGRGVEFFAFFSFGPFFLLRFGLGGLVAVELLWREFCKPAAAAAAF